MAYAIARVLTRSKSETHPVSDKRSSSATPTSSGQLPGSKSVRPVRLDSAGRASDGRQAQPYVSMGSRQQGHRSTKAVTSLSNRRSDIPPVADNPGHVRPSTRRVFPAMIVDLVSAAVYS
jgi:hypothetical protein